MVWRWAKIPSVILRTRAIWGVPNSAACARLSVEIVALKYLIQIKCYLGARNELFRPLQLTRANEAQSVHQILITCQNRIEKPWKFDFTTLLSLQLPEYHTKRSVFIYKNCKPRDIDVPNCRHAGVSTKTLCCRQVLFKKSLIRSLANKSATEVNPLKIHGIKRSPSTLGLLSHQ